MFNVSKKKRRAVSLAAFVLTALALGIVQTVVRPPLLLLERFIPGAGWIEVFALAAYAAVLAALMLDPKRSAHLRVRIWAFFSFVFFTQLALGLAGIDRMLMTGHLHLPVPALIVAGPLFRAGGLFMLILFTVTVLIVGPAWCSHLCYIGSWDDIASRVRSKPSKMPRWRSRMRLALMLGVFALAWGLGRVGVPAGSAVVLAAMFGLAGVAAMVFWSARTGVMTHCTALCPMGWVATRLGKLSPFRIRIDRQCEQCGSCTKACRYDALSMDDVARRRPGASCTLCGDCQQACENRSIGYRFLTLSPTQARALFTLLVVSLHAVFLGTARM